jgi:transposase
LRWADVLDFFKKLSPCLVGMEACGGAHYWAREIAKCGHDVRLVPPSYVKPFVKRAGELDSHNWQVMEYAVTRILSGLNHRFARI